MSGQFPKLPIPFGGGLDRNTGVMAVEPVAFADLRNVHLYSGKAELRKGHTATVDLASAEELVVGVFPLRAQGVGALIAYDSATGKVRLYLVTGAGEDAALIGEVWALGAGADPPRVIASDSYDKLFIAHDEPSIALRQTTKVYDLFANTITALQANLDGLGVADVKFRGVRRRLAYMTGWGYGTASDPDRPEVVRISLPAAPTTFEANHYYLAGQRGDPVIDCADCADVFAVRKESESYKIIGYDRATFGILPLDQHFGQIGARNGITVGGINYFWSHEGPRRSTGGASEDLALPLDLGGPSPDTLATDPVLENGFCVYQPVRRVILWIFGRWCYQLSIADPDALRWSYRELPFTPFCGGLLYESTGVTTGAPSITSLSLDSIDTPLHNAFTCHYTAVGTLVGGEVMQLWVKHPVASLLDDDWYLAASSTMVALTGTITAPGLWPGVTYDAAIRVVRSAIPMTGSTSATPSDWPAGQQESATTDLLTPDVQLAEVAWRRSSGSQEYLRCTVPAGPNQDDALALVETYATWEAQIDPGGGYVSATTAVTTYDPPYSGAPGAVRPTTFAVDVDANTYGETTVLVQIRQVTAYKTSAWSTARAMWVGPIEPIPGNIDTVGYVSPQYHVTWTNGGVYTGAKISAGYGLNPSSWGAEVDIPYASGEGGICELACPATNASVRGRARHYWTQFAVTDYSDYVKTEDTTPNTCP